MARKPKPGIFAKRKSYEVTNEDFEIFKLGARNANYITDHFMRTPTSGTYWRNKTPDDLQYDEDRQRAWEIMRSQWATEGMPDIFNFSLGPHQAKYATQYDSSGEPVFFHNHGWLWQPWQLKIHHSPQPDVTVVGGYGSTALNTRIYEADLRKYVTLRWCIEHDHSPVVLSRTRSGWAKVKASIPYYEGTGALYRVTTQSGKVLDATPKHQVLTSRGYVHILDLNVGDRLVVPDTLPATVQSGVADDSRYQKTTSNCQDDYLTDSRLYDGPPHRQSNASQSSAPLQDGALRSIHSPSSFPDSSQGQESECTCLLCLDAAHPRKQGSTRLLVRHAETGFPLRFREASAGPVRPEQADRALYVSEDKSIQYWQDVLSSDCIDPEPTASFSDEMGQLKWSYSDALLTQAEMYDAYQDNLLSQSKSHTHPQALAGHLGLTSPNFYVNPYSLSRQNSSLYVYERNYTSLDEVTSIEYIGERDYYDIHAPIYNNYVAEGMVHHNCGKTAAISMSLAVLAATIPNFRGFAVAPQMLQAMEVYNYLNTALLDTPYWDKFVVASPKRPMPQFVIENSYVGRSTIEIFSIEDDPEKIRTLEGDVAYLDQAEKFDDLEQIERDLGSRLRGSVRGRARLGKMVWIANAGDNPQLWYRFDQAEYQPQFYLSLNPRSIDNPYLSKTDIANLKRRVGGSAEEVEQWMEGRRPMGSGEHFSRKMVETCVDESLTETMERIMELPETAPARQGFIHRKTQQLGTFHWEMPPDTAGKRDYIVISDPGSSDPPSRNSAIIMVFDVTDFPNRPMTLRAFNWIFGHGSYWTWVLAYKDYVERYRAFGRNAFDSTGVQKGFDELVFHEMHLAAEGMNMAVGGKMLALNALKFFMGKGLVKFPYIPHLTNQLTSYKLPDNNIRQDLVMCIAMAAAWARRLYYVELDDEEQFTQDGQVSGESDRYGRSGNDRYDRPTLRDNRENTETVAWLGPGSQSTLNS